MALLALGGPVACGSDSGSSSSTQATATASKASADALDAADAKVLSQAKATIDACKASSTSGEDVGAVATLESLYQIDPKATAGGTSVEEAVADARAKLQQCGKTALARRLAKLTG